MGGGFGTLGSNLGYQPRPKYCMILKSETSTLTGAPGEQQSARVAPTAVIIGPV
jgi:hypothetical protein